MRKITTMTIRGPRCLRSQHRSVSDRIGAAMVLGLLSMLTASCGTKGTPSAGQFAIYTLQDTTLTVAAAAEQDLGTLVLQPRPFVTVDDITEVSWSKQSIAVTPDMRSRLAALGAKPYKSAGIPFVVVVGDERVYLGAFWYGYSSSYPRVPYLTLPPRDPMFLELMALGAEGGVDPRADPRVRASLQRAGVLVE